MIYKNECILYMLFKKTGAVVVNGRKLYFLYAKQCGYGKADVFSRSNA